MANTLAPLAKCVAREAGQRLDPEEETLRVAFMAFRHALSWSRRRAAFELSVARSTIEAWEHREPKKHQRIPAAPFEKMRRLASEKGLDSCGRMRAAAG